jgi:hypothetical protein
VLGSSNESITELCLECRELYYNCPLLPLVQTKTSPASPFILLEGGLKLLLKALLTFAVNVGD